MIMLCYKSWRETRARFLLSVLAIAGCCAAFVLFTNDASAATGDAASSYPGYIWHVTYKNYLRELFVLLAVLLGAGGLLRERDYRTAGFTLCLPVSRWRLVAARASVGIVEIGLLSLVPAAMIPLLSPLIHESYSLSQALQFSVLWTICGGFFFLLGFLSSVIFPGEFTAPLVALVALLLYSAIVDVPVVERLIGDINDIMSGEGMPYFRADTFTLTGPLPWTSLAIILAISLALVGLAATITRRQDF